MFQSVLHCRSLPKKRSTQSRIITIMLLLPSYLPRGLQLHGVHILRNRHFSVTLKGYNVINVTKADEWQGYPANQSQRWKRQNYQLNFQCTFSWLLKFQFLSYIQRRFQCLCYIQYRAYTYKLWMAISTNEKHWWKDNWRENRSTRRKTWPIQPLCPPQIQGIPRNRTWESAVTKPDANCHNHDTSQNFQFFCHQVSPTKRR